MPYKYRRICPICNKLDLLYLCDHLRQVHNLYGNDRKRWLKMAVFSPPKAVHTLPTALPLAQEPHKEVRRPSRPLLRRRERKQGDVFKTTPILKTEAYPEFKFRHKFSLLVVGPTQSGKTYFVQQILESKAILFEKSRPMNILWCYNQHQNCYDAMKRKFGSKIYFFRGLPKFSDNLEEIDPKVNNIIVLDDLMAEASDSPLVAGLFTQGRHRNASVILMLQNMFPKGKYNTDISRNAQYMALFRSPSDRKQIGIIGERMFDKNRDRFMSAYYKETEKPYGYLLVDNKPDTPVNKPMFLVPVESIRLSTVRKKNTSMNWKIHRFHKHVLIQSGWNQ